MALAVKHDLDFYSAMRDNETTAVFANPETPSPVSMSDAITKQVSTFPWLASSDVPLRALGYKDDVLTELQADRRRFAAQELVRTAAQSE